MKLDSCVSTSRHSVRVSVAWSSNCAPVVAVLRSVTMAVTSGGSAGGDGDGEAATDGAVASGEATAWVGVAAVLLSDPQATARNRTTRSAEDARALRCRCDKGHLDE